MTTMTTTLSTDDILGQSIVSIRSAITLHSKPNVKFVDGSWFLGGDRNAREEYQNGPRIEGSRFLDIDEIASKSHSNSNLPHMMPSAKLFGATMDALDISYQDHVIVYGSKDCMFVSRAFWQFRVMGHAKSYCHLLDGSLEDWTAEGGPVEGFGTKPSYPIITHDQAMARARDESVASIYKATEPQNIVTMDQLKALIADGKARATNDMNGATIVDVRAPPRFHGQVEEPRPGLRLGHMPGSKNLFFLDLLDPNHKVRFKSKDELRQIIINAGLSLPLSSTIIATCGSGATACVLLTALDILGEDDFSKLCLYDGSWAEWGSYADTPIVKED